MLDKIKVAVDVLKKYEPEEGYYVAFSGGKDSLCIYWLTKIAQVKCDYHYNFTTVDPPELVKFVRSFEDVKIEHPGVDKTMWNLIVTKKFPPTQLKRYCCKELKEGGGKDRIKIVGVRSEESSKRKGRSVIEFDSPLGRVINLIYDWSEDDVWQFIHCNLLEYCELYDNGYDRLGCIGCPMQYHTQTERNFERYSLYMKAYIKTFDNMLLNIPKDKNITWNTGLDVFDWWVYGNAYISKKRIAKYPNECSNCKYLGHKLICEFYCNSSINKKFIDEI